MVVAEEKKKCSNRIASTREKYSKGAVAANEQTGSEGMPAAGEKN